MWCIECQQDVPGVVSSRGDGRLCCSRCGEQLSTGGAPLADDELDGWDLEADLEELETLAAEPAAPRPQAAVTATPAWRVDSPHPAASAPAPSPGPLAPPHSSAGAWMLVMLGTAIGMAGTVLTGWSIWIDQPQLWKVGLAAAAAGVLVLQAGGVLLLDQASQNRRQLEQQLSQIRHQLEHLQRPSAPPLSPSDTILASIKRQLDSLV